MRQNYFDIRSEIETNWRSIFRFVWNEDAEYQAFQIANTKIGKKY